MPNAAATLDDDFGYEPKPRKTTSRKPRTGAPSGRKKAAKRRQLDMHRIAKVAAIGMAATMALGIMVNALMLQKGHHPAPLFGHAGAPPAAQAKKEAPAPLASKRAAEADDVPAAAAATTPRTTVVTAHAAKPERASDDAIGRLLAGGSKSMSVGDLRSDVKLKAKAEAKTIGGVQRALSKLGFKVAATGAVGPATKKAIEAFERDRHLPVKGDVDHRLVKVLAAESGVKID